MNAQNPTDVTLVAQAIGSHRGALLAYNDDLTIEQAREINETSGFTIERMGGLGSTLRIEGVHLTDEQLAGAYRQSDEFLA